MRGTDGASFTGLAASSAAFALNGGTYGMLADWTSPSGLTATLSMLGPSGDYISVGAATAFAHASGYGSVALPSGTFKIILTGSAGGGESVAISIARIPGE